MNRLIRRQAIGQTIIRTLLIDAIAQSIPLDPQESEQLIETFLQSRPVSGADPRRAYLEAEGIDDADLCWRATTERRLQIHRHRHHGEDVESLYLERKLELDQVIYSLIRVGDADLAAELHQQILEGEADFGSLARLHSLGAERFRRGPVGPVPLAAAHPELMHRLRSGEPGQLWDPFFVVDVWLLVRLEEHLPAELNEDLRQRLEQELFERWLEARVQAFLAGEELVSPDRA